MHNLLGGTPIRHRSGRVVALGSTAVLAAAGAGPLVLLTSSTASANVTWVVSTLADSGAGSLREVMIDANETAGVDTITFMAGLTGTINVLSDLPELEEGIDLQGPGASVITINGGWTEAGGDSTGHALFVLKQLYGADGASTISGVTITGGNASNNADAGSGGAIQKSEGNADLTIADVVLSGNYASNDGGAVHLYETAGTVTIRNSVISNNVAYYAGGALYASNNPDRGVLFLNVSNVEISGNTAGDDGGGLYLEQTITTISNSTIHGNVSGDNGGGIEVEQGSLTIIDSTISGNEGVTGGGIYAEQLYADLEIFNSTISGNRATSDSEPYLYNGNTFVSGGGGGIYLANGAGAVLIQSTVTANSSDALTNAVGGIQSVQGRLEPLSTSGSSARRQSNERKENRSIETSLSPSAAGDLTLIGSIVAGNDGADIGIWDGSAPVTNAEYSVLGAIQTGVTLVDGGGTQVGVTDPKLGLLADNGGATKTHALLAGSPAINAGPNPVPVFDGNEFDQRGVGFARIAFGVADAGAFEVQEPPATEPIAPTFTG